jgi:hypothetical protein
MEYRRRSLWNRIWENDSLDSLSKDEYERYIYEGEYRPWREICHGVVLSMWKSVFWIFKGKN